MRLKRNAEDFIRSVVFHVRGVARHLTYEPLSDRYIPPARGGQVVRVVCVEDRPVIILDFYVEFH